ncbi:ImmA/IrrE family metallo-endopeptidase [Aeromonas enteropelogenes]|uniref:ImmA/IrrE family metallo-endopeptidase n=1 Tax=Aeromonas enteropelogenes TaxID=29489 RepID=UPI003BA19A23
MTFATDNRKNIISLADAQGISSAAELLYAIYGDVKDLELPIDIEDIARKIEVVNLLSEFDIKDLFVSGLLKIIRSENGSVDKIDIWVNPTEVVTRQRFTLAHEIGHLFNDVLPHIDNLEEDVIVDVAFNRGTIKSHKETKADRFAAQLLMPPQLISRELSLLVSILKEKNEKVSIDYLIKILSNKFLVSEKAMKIRLETLGYIKSSDDGKS